MQGRIAQVSIRDLGSSLAVDHAAGVTELYVANANDFSDFGNDVIEVDGLQYTTIQRIDGDTEDDYDILVLDTPLALETEGGTAVVLIPRSQEKVASVEVEDEEDDFVEAAVPFEYAALLVDGIREPENQELVEVEINDDGEWEVTAVVGETPVLDGAYLGGDLPDFSEPTEPPPSSPTPEAHAGSGVVVLTWDHVDTTTFYDLHAFVPTEAAPTPPTPSSATLHTSNVNSPAWIGDVNGVPLSTTSDTYFALVGRNSKGAAEPSPWVMGCPGAIVTEPLIASLAIVQRTISELVQTAGLEIGTGSWTAAEGLNIPGVLELPVDGSTEKAKLYAEIIARGITISDYLSMRGENNTLEPASELTLGEGIGAPKRGPSFGGYWPVTSNLVPLTTLANEPLDLNQVVGYHRHSDTDHSFLLYGTLDGKASAMQIKRYVNGAFHSKSNATGVAAPANGLLLQGNVYYHLFRNSNGYYQLASYNLQGTAGQPILGTGFTAVLPYSNAYTRKPCIAPFDGTRYRVVGFTTNSLTGALYPFAGGNPLEAFAFTQRNGDPFFDVSAVLQNVGGLYGGTNLLTVVGPGKVESYQVNSNTAEGGIVRVRAADFPTAYGRVVRASSGLYTVDAYGAVHKYRSSLVSNLRAVYTWADLNTAGTGEHETAISPPTAVATGSALPRGASVRLTAQAAPVLAGNDDSPTDELFYISTSNGPWYLVGAGDSLQNVVFENAPTSGATPGARPAFPVTIPALLRSFAAALADSSKGMVELRGDGSAQVGPFESDKNGGRLKWGIVNVTTAAKAVADSTWTVVNTFPGGFSRNGAGAVSMGGDLLVSESGLYYVSFHATWANSQTGRRIVALEVYNPGQAVAAGAIMPFEEKGAAGTIAPSCQGSTDVWITAGQRVRMIAYHTAGANLNLAAGARMTVRKVG